MKLWYLTYDVHLATLDKLFVFRIVLMTLIQITYIGLLLSCVLFHHSFVSDKASL